MKAVLCKSLDGPEGVVITDVPEPVAGPGEVVVAVSAAALNFFDTLITRGKYQTKPELPFSPGGEIAGRVVAVGPGAEGLAVGDRVAAYVGYGGARERVAVPAIAAVKIPDNVPDDIASGVSITYGTAIHGLKDRGHLKPGETVAVLGAAGGAGLAAVEIAKAFGATVIAVASSPEKLAIAKAHGADAAIDYAAITDLKQALRDATGGAGVDIVYDCVGGPHAEPALRALKWSGRYLVVGFASGEVPKFPLNLLLVKGVSVTGVFWGESVARDPLGHRANMTDILAAISAARLHPRLHARYPLDAFHAALGVIERREAEGKVVLMVGE